MGFVLDNRRFPAGFALAGIMLALAACQSGDSTGFLDLGSDGQAAAPEQITALELRAFCPQVTLRDGTAYFNAYERGGEGDRSRLTYQASISDVTRSCTNSGGLIAMNVAVAGRVVPGPLGQPGTVTMPIRIAVVRGDEVLYSQLHQHQVEVGTTTGATQFVFNDPNVTVPAGQERGVRIFAGYDDGPQD